MHKDARKVAKELKKQGFEVTATKSGHYEVRKDGRKVTTISGSPSDHRSLKNTIQQARRAGFVWQGR